MTNYGPLGILWFDGEWENTWTHDRGKDLYAYVRGLQPDIIVNNRVGKNRAGHAGLSKGDESVGDYGTPEQEIPANGLPGVDWESCMTMNDHWGYNKNDQNWKSSASDDPHVDRHRQQGRQLPAERRPDLRRPDSRAERRAACARSASG